MPLENTISTDRVVSPSRCRAFSGRSAKKQLFWKKIVLIIVYLGVQGALLGYASAFVPTITWVSTIDGFWDDPANWRDSVGASRLPNASDDVLIDVAGMSPTVTIRSAQSVHSLLARDPLTVSAASLTIAVASDVAGRFSLVNSTLAVNGTMTTTGNSSWSGSALVGSANLLNSGTLTLSGTNSLGGLLENSGTIVHQSGNLQLGFAIGTQSFVGTLNNRGLYDLQTDATISQQFTSSINNGGTVRKSAGTGTATVNVRFNNTGGTIDVESGTLSLAGEGGIHTGGTFSAGGGATLIFTGTHMFTGTYTGSGSGLVEFTGGNFGIGPSGAVFNFAGGLLRWVDGRIDGGSTGLTNVGTVTVVRGSSNAVILFDKVSNAGTLIESGLGLLEIDGSATLTNLSGALIDIQGDGGIVETNIRAGPHAFLNRGTVRKSVGTITNINVSGFDTNEGTIDVRSGTLVLGAGSSTGGNFTVAAGATLDLTGGNTVTYSGNYAGSGQGTVLLANGTLVTGTGGATFNLPAGLFQWTGGTINGGTSGLTNAGAVTLSGANTKFLGGVLNNTGTIIHQSGNLQLAFEIGTQFFPGTLNNSGLYDLQTDATISQQFTSSINNGGTFRKSAGTGTATVNVPFNNTGTLEVRSGTFALSSTPQISGTALTGGTWNVFGNSTLSLPSVIVTNQANIILDAPGSTVPAINGLNSNPGGFTLLGGRSFTTNGNLENTGNLTLGPGSALNVSGTYSQSAAGSFTVRIGGSPPSGQFGKLISTGTASLDGTLNVTLANGFGPSLGDSFPVMSFGAHTASFATINGMTLGRFPLFAANLSPTNLTLNTVTAAADLAVTDVQIETASVSPGQSATVSYTVKNQSSTPATGDWYDSVYLSTNNFVDPQAAVLGRLHHVGDVAGLSSYTGTLTAPVPALLERGYRVIVITDSRGLVPDANRANNTGLSSTTLGITIPTLSIGGTATGTIADGQDVYHRLVVPPGEDLALSATYSATPEAELYLRYGALPDRTNFDQAAADPNVTSATLTLTNAQGGDYYILLHGREGAVGGKSFTLSAQAQQFQILSFDPHVSLNQANETMTLEGTKFTPHTTVRLIAADGTAFPSGSVSLIDPDHLSATFDLSAVPIGSYAVRAQDGPRASTASAAFKVSNAVVGNFSSVTIMSPARVRVGAPISVSIGIHGLKDSFVPVPFIEVDASNVAKGQEQQQLVDPKLPLFLAPGQNAGFGIIYDPQPHAAGTISPFNLQLISLTQTIDWDGQKDALRPAGVPADAWDAVWANLRPKLGSIVGDFYKLLGQDGSALNANGVTTNSVNRLFTFERSKANDQWPSPVQEQVVDLSFPSSGLSLAFGRSFLSTVVGRYHLGRMGRGWIDNFDISATTDTTAGLVRIQEGSITRYFSRQVDGSFKGTAGDYGTLSQVNGGYHLREKNGVLTVFRTDGSLDFLQDTNNNRIIAGYTGAQLTTLTHSNGAVMGLKYNAQGRIGQVTDPVGRVATYQYDSSGEHLQSATTAAGTTAYDYTADARGPRAHSLASITNPAGTHLFFEYDSEGRLKSQQRDNGAEAFGFSYGLASYRVTDAQNNSTIFFYDDAGHILRTQNALGHLSFAQYDSLNNLRLIQAEGRGSTTFTPDSLGNLKSVVDPLSAKQIFSYDSTFNHLASWTDALHNPMTFGQDANGNPNSITYADNSSETFQYDAQGNARRAVDRNSQVALYTYDPNGLLKTRQSLSDDSLTTYDYDAHTNLHTITTAGGIITLDYDAADRLSKITYPNGRSLNYSYDAGGRRIQTVDQSGFTVNFGYDGVGRLVALTDGSGKLIVQYSYNELSQLRRKGEGNGAFTTYDYDANGQLLHLINFAPDNSVNSRFDYTYDVLGRRDTMTTLEGTTTYGYDGDGRLTSVTLPNNSRTITYQYDDAGNRQTVTDNGVTTGYTTNNLNEYAAIGGTTNTYDQAGNLVATDGPGGSGSYTYDALNRLIGVTNASGTWTYEYDALDNRTAVVHNGQRTEYLVDPLGLGNVFSEYNGSGQLLAHYTRGLRLASRVDASGAADYYDFDATGSTVGLIGPGGIYVNRYRYLPFGESLSASESVANLFQYNGALGVQADGSGLNYMRARYYDPAQGRFTQPDPIGLIGGSNFYSYVLNNPISNNDPTGTGLPSWVQVIHAARLAMQLITVDPTSRPPKDPFVESAETQRVVDRSQSATKALRGGSSGSRGFVELEALGYFWGVVALQVEVIALFDALASGGQYFFTGTLPLCIGIPGEQENLLCESPSSGGGTPAGHSLTEQIDPSHDPNFLSGPAGFGASGFIVGDATWPYYIAFENQPSAGSPAQQVVITEKLDPNLDLNTFQLGDFGFSDVTIHVPKGRQVFNTRIDKRETLGVFVDVNASLNTQTRVLAWTFTALDPQTLDLPSDPLVGFLPPDKTSPQGEGFVSYFIHPNSGLASGTPVSAQASIVFDVNAPVPTNVFLNTIDAEPPTSSITALPAIEPTNSFTINWSGSDGAGSGIASFDVFVSKDSGAYTPVVQATPTTSALFTGEAGHTYSFYSVATDNVGQREADKTRPDTTTTVRVQSGYTFTTLDVPGSTTSEARGINAVGKIVGFFGDSYRRHGFLYTQGTFTTLDVPRSSATEARGINAKDQIVGNFHDPSGKQHGFLYNRGAFTTLDMRISFATEACGINTEGQTVGTFLDARGKQHGFLYNRGTFTTLNVPSSLATEASGINAGGQIVGSFRDAGGKQHGFLYTQETFTTLDVPGSTATEAFGLNAEGQIVGAFHDTSGKHGFLHANAAFTTLNVPASTGTTANGINDKGQIVGSFNDVNGTLHGFLATP